VDPAPTQADRRAGRLIQLAAVAILVALATVVVSFGREAYLVVAFSYFLIVPPVAAAVFSIVTGAFLRAGSLISRLTATVSSCAVAVCSATFLWLWLRARGEEFKSEPLLHGAGRTVMIVAFAAIALLALAGPALLLRQRIATGPAPLPRGARAFAGTASILAVVATAAVSALFLIDPRASGTSIEFHEDPKEVAARCADAQKLAATPLDRLEVGAPAPPIPAGAQVIGASIVRPFALGEPAGPGLNVSTQDRSTVTVIAIAPRKSPEDQRAGALEAVSRAGLTASGGGTSTVNGKLEGWGVFYEGDGVRGSISPLDCAPGLLLVKQEIRPDRVGRCKEPAYAAKCAEVYQLAVTLLEKPSPRPRWPDVADYVPLTVTVDARGVPTAHLREHLDSSGSTFVSNDFAEAFAAAGWTRVGLRKCDENSIDHFDCERENDVTFKTDITLQYAKGGHHAVVRIKPTGPREGVGAPILIDATLR
jgi:hypothetical protein